MYISSVLYLLSIYGYRLALLLMYIRLFGVSKPFRYATLTVMTFVTGYLFSNFLTLLFGCTPIQKYWRPEEPGHCIDLNKADYAYGSMNVASDVLLFLLPLPMVYRLNLSRKDKFGVFLIFMGGIAYVPVYSNQILCGQQLMSLQQLRSDDRKVCPSGRQSQCPRYTLVGREDLSPNVSLCFWFLFSPSLPRLLLR